MMENKWLKKYDLFLESKKSNAKTIIREICTSMVLINNGFLDDILDRGKKARYTENSEVFLLDLKNLIVNKNRVKLGQFIDGKCVEDDEISKINKEFSDIEFNIEKDWKVLNESRLMARSIMDKLLPEDKVNEDFIKNIFWLGPNKTKENNEDIVIELSNGKQYSIFLNKTLSTQKSASFNKLADDLIGDNIDKLYKGEYLNMWNRLTKEWVNLIYENVDSKIKYHIDKFISYEETSNMRYLDYINRKHKNPKYKHLGEHIKEFNRNILEFKDLMNEIWKKRKTLFSDLEKVERIWDETKIVLLNSKILENLFTTSLSNMYSDQIEKIEDGFKKPNSRLKMKLFKIMVEKMGSTEKDLYYVSKNGKDFNMIPSRSFFRNNYKNLDLLFDYHVPLKVKEVDNNDFNMKFKLLLNGSKLLDMNIYVKFNKDGISDKLSSKYVFDFDKSFNYEVSKNL